MIERFDFAREHALAVRLNFSEVPLPLATGGHARPVASAKGTLWPLVWGDHGKFVAGYRDYVYRCTVFMDHPVNDFRDALDLARDLTILAAREAKP